MTIGFYKNVHLVDNNDTDFDIIGCEETNEFLCVSGRSIIDAIEYLLATNGWSKDSVVGRCIFTISEETHPEYFI